MVTFDIFRQLALSLPKVTEEPHFGKTSFRINKKIFATYSINPDRATLKLSEIDQDVFSSHNRSVIYPVNNKWGKQGWTVIELEQVNEDLFLDALKTSYCLVAPKFLVEQLKHNEDK